MPLPKGTRFRVVKKGGKKIRLAFKQGTSKVIEAKNIGGGGKLTIKVVKKRHKKRVEEGRKDLKRLVVRKEKVILRKKK